MNSTMSGAGPDTLTRPHRGQLRLREGAHTWFRVRGRQDDAHRAAEGRANLSGQSTTRRSHIKALTYGRAARQRGTSRSPERAGMDSPTYYDWGDGPRQHQGAGRQGNGPEGTGVSVGAIFRMGEIF